MGPDPEDYEDLAEAVDHVPLQMDIEAEMEAIISNNNANKSPMQQR